MLRLIRIVGFLLLCLLATPLFSQDIVTVQGIEFVRYSFPTEKGEDIDCVLLTSVGFESLLKRIQSSSSGGENSGGEPNKDQTERQYLLANATSARYIAQRYNKTNSNRNGYSTIEIAYLFGFADVDLRKTNSSSYLSEMNIAGLIYNRILEIRQSQ